MSARLIGAGEDTPKLKSELKRIHDVLVGAIPPKVEVRQKIEEMLQGIRDGLQKAGSGGNLTRFAGTNSLAILRGLGLDPATSRILQQRLAQIGVNGTVPGSRSQAFAGAGAIVTHTTINLDGKAIAQNTTTHQQRTTARRAVSRRGPYAGHH